MTNDIVDYKNWEGNDYRNRAQLNSLFSGVDNEDWSETNDVVGHIKWERIGSIKVTLLGVVLERITGW